jgi:prolipoprotein diacylglyceryl transferase
MIFSQITWNVSPELINLGPISVRWYGLLFAMAFVVGYIILTWIYKQEGRPKSEVEQFTIYVIIGTVIGARLGHCLFYNPEFYLSNPIEVLKVWRGGLASHGAAVGIVLALYLYCKKMKDVNLIWLLDRVVIVVALGGAFIRLGNLFNSEIIGIPTDAAWAFIFVRVDDTPRHPAQLYESIAYFLTFLVILFTYIKKRKSLGTGFIFGLFLIMVFSFRFFIEIIKENQSDFEAGMLLNMGQLLSIPFIIAGVIFIIKSFKTPSKKELKIKKKIT